MGGMELKPNRTSTFWEPQVLLAPSTEDEHAGIINQHKMKRKERDGVAHMKVWFNYFSVNTPLFSQNQEFQTISADVLLSAGSI